MPIVIGAKRESSFTDPIGLLGDCHRRVERFLAVLVHVAEQAHGEPFTGERRTAWDTALRYFREAAPKHTADEEESLFPRLRAMDRSDVKALLARVDGLELDHVRAAQAHAEIDRLGLAWLANGRLSQEDAARLIAVLADLAELYRAHLAIEDTEVFPLAAEVLSATDREAIGGEMAVRRGLGPRTSVTRQG
jgi:hemerythrin-like domain-containing protein